MVACRYRRKEGKLGAGMTSAYARNEKLGVLRVRVQCRAQIYINAAAHGKKIIATFRGQAKCVVEPRNLAAETQISPR